MVPGRECAFDFPARGTFLHNHAPEVAAMDFFVVPTIGFDLLYVCVPKT
jgi:hypothetical protein